MESKRGRAQRRQSVWSCPSSASQLGWALHDTYDKCRRRIYWFVYLRRVGNKWGWNSGEPPPLLDGSSSSGCTQYSGLTHSHGRQSLLISPFCQTQSCAAFLIDDGNTVDGGQPLLLRRLYGRKTFIITAKNPMGHSTICIPKHVVPCTKTCYVGQPGLLGSVPIIVAYFPS